MGFRNISAWSIRNPVPAIVLFAALTIAGFVSFMRMNVNASPDITFPAASVVIAQPGAAPTELETQVTRKVEGALRSLENVDVISSTASEGQSTTTVQFEMHTPVDRAVNDVRDAIANIRSDLPDGITEPQVQRITINGDSIVDYSVEGSNLTMEQLSWFVQNQVTRRLLGIGGVAQIELTGSVNREIRVLLDPARMQAQGVTASAVNQTLRAINTNAAGGRAEIAGSEQSVRILGNAADAFALSQTQISVGGNAIGGGARTVKLADIADVRDSYGEVRSFAKMNGHPIVSFGVQVAKGASDVAVYDGVKAEIAKIEKENPGIHFSERFNSVNYTKDQYHAALDSIVEGALLAVAVVFLFLRDARATVIAALAIPLSAIPTFWFMDLMGFTLNFMTLVALSLVAGVLVDDAIVEIENIVRHMRMGKTAWQASIDAADEIGLAVVATTFSIVAVFLPVGFMPGIPGQFFSNFGITIVVAVLISLAVARLVTPMVAAYFLKSHGVAEHGGGRLMAFYERVLRWTLGHRWWTMSFGVIAFVMTIWAFATLPFTFQPPLDYDFSRVRIEMPPGSTLRQTEAVADQVTRILGAEQEVKQPVEYINTGTASVWLTLKPDRKRSSTEFERALGPVLHRIPDARIDFQSQEGGGPSISNRPVAIMLASDDPIALKKGARMVVEQMKTLPDLRSPRIDGDLSRPEVTIKPRLDLAADMGVTTAALSQAIRIATLGEIDQNAAKFSLADRQIPIRVMLSQASRRDLATIRNLPVATSRGGSVPLGVVADVGFGEGPAQIRRYNQERRIILSADLAPGAVSGAERQKVLDLPVMKQLPPGVHYVVAGDAKLQAQLVSNFVISVTSGVMLVLAVLILLYRRVMPPFVNLGSLLLAPLGGALALHACGMPISMPVLIGMLMLLGIVAKNSILLIDFAIEEMRLGKPSYDAIMEAGHKRAQPILMTTVAMVAGMTPTALALGGDGSFNQPMAVVVIGGLILSTALTLLIVPAGFSLADSIEKWIGPRLAGALTNGGEGGTVGGAPQPAE